MEIPFDSEVHLEIVRRAKRQIRAQMKALRGGHSKGSLASRSRRIGEMLLAHPRVAKARAVANFWPMVGRGEVDLREFDQALRTRGIEIYYPFMDPLPGGRTLTGFRLAESSGDLIERGRGFLEPPPDAKVAERGEVDAVVVPALAVDGQGYRIGYGAGYYDATLGDLCPPAISIIVAYHFQLLAELPHEPHDRPCDWVLTDQTSFEVSARHLAEGG